MIHRFLITAWVCAALCPAIADGTFVTAAKDVFDHPPKTAHVGIWWHWMGRQVSKDGIVKDLDWMVRMGINSATIFGMADATTPWAKRIANVPTDIGEPYSDKWWEMVRFACAEGKKRQIEIGLHNCPGYTSTGGKWVTSERSMRELVFAKAGEKPKIDKRAHAPFPVYDDEKKAIAFLNAYPECGSYLLDYLAVHESCRGEGYGSILLKKCGQLLDGKPMLIETEAVFAAQNEAEKQERIQRNQFYQKNGARMTDACIRMFGVIFTMWTLYDEVGLSKEEIGQEMERHYRYMLMDTALYEANAEIPYEE